MTATPPGAAVTVSTTRRVDAGREPEMSAWVRTGLSLGERFPGFLGGGWVRGADDAPDAVDPWPSAVGGEPGGEGHAGPGRAEWHLLHRFSDPGTLAGCEQSGPREPPVVRIAVLSLAQTPVRTYLLLPWLTRRLSRRLDHGARDRG